MDPVDNNLDGLIDNLSISFSSEDKIKSILFMIGHSYEIKVNINIFYFNNFNRILIIRKKYHSNFKVLAKSQ